MQKTCHNTEGHSCKEHLVSAKGWGWGAELKWIQKQELKESFMVSFT